MIEIIMCTCSAGIEEERNVILLDISKLNLNCLIN